MLIQNAWDWVDTSECLERKSWLSILTPYLSIDEATVISLNRGIRDALTHSTKLKHEYQEAVTRTEAVGTRLQIEKARQKALSDLLEDTQKELQNLLEESVRQAYLRPE